MKPEITKICVEYQEVLTFDNVIGMRLIRNIIFLCIVFSFSIVSAQTKSKAEIEFEKQYQKRIQQESLFGVYIPVDMEDAFVELSRLSDKNNLEYFKMAPEDSIKTRLHYGLGRWMIYNWQFYEGSRFSHYLKEKGISHPDDMAQFMIVSFHRKLNGVPQEYDSRIEVYKEKYEQEKLAREAAKTLIKSEKRIKKKGENH